MALTPVNNADLIIPAMLRALGLSPLGAADPKTQLYHFLQHKSVLFVLDNLEHLVEGVDRLAELLELVPGVKFLVISRVQLHLVGEWLFEVQGLPNPPSPGSGPLVLNLQKSSAVALFLQPAHGGRS